MFLKILKLFYYVSFFETLRFRNSNFKAELWTFVRFFSFFLFFKYFEMSSFQKIEKDIFVIVLKHAFWSIFRHILKHVYFI